MNHSTALASALFLLASQITASQAAPLALGLHMSATYGSPGPAGLVDITLEGSPLAQGLVFADLRLNEAGHPAIFEAWLSLSTSARGRSASLRAGFLDLTGAFDSSDLANSEVSQFIRPEFVDNPVLGQPASSPGLMLMSGAGEGLNFRLGLQNESGPDGQAWDRNYLISELEFLHAAWGARVWGRQDSAQVHALGGVLDLKLGRHAALFSRISHAEDGLDHLSAGLESAPLAVWRPEDRLAMAWGGLRGQDGWSREFAEAYYKAQLGPQCLASLHYQADFSRLTEALDAGGFGAADSRHRILARLSFDL